MEQPMTRWPSILFGTGLIVLGCIAFFDIFGFDAMGPYLRSGSHTHLSMIALATTSWLVVGSLVMRTVGRRNPHPGD
jgi:hypothetical protein